MRKVKDSYGIRLHRGRNWRWYFRDRNKNIVYYARAVMEGHLRRPLERGEVVHHINGDSTDDRLENLRLYSSHSEHMREEFLSGALTGLKLGPAASHANDPGRVT